MKLTDQFLFKEKNILIQQPLFFNETEKAQSWFTEALNAFSLSESPGWPDRFGNSLRKWFKDNKNIEIRVLSLFSGAGGLDIGFHDAGFKIVECNEIEKVFASTLSANGEPGRKLRGRKIVCLDINDYDPEFQDIDFIIGGPPCQTFSAASARAAGVNGIDDDRGNLFHQYVRILKKLSPKGFLFENVYRIVGAQGGKPWQLIQQAFTEAGYKLHWRILDAADFGAPQFRERLIIVGLKKGEFQFPYPTHGPDSMDNRPYYSAGVAIGGMVSRVSHGKIGGRHGHLLNDIPPGLNYSFYTERMGHPTPHFGWRSKFSDYLYKADPNTPVRTIKAQGGQYTGPFHWENRRFTIEELKRLQTFPDDYIIAGNRQNIIRQLGNSVPPQLARVLALGIARQVFDAPLPFELALLPDAFQLGFRTRKNKLTKIYEKKAADAIETMKSNHRTKRERIESKKEHAILAKNFVLQSVTKDMDWEYCFKHEISNRRIFIQLWDKTKSDNIAYRYAIEPHCDFQSNSELELIEMQSYTTEPSSITAIWKHLEKLIKNYYYKDDLVQFFGYYQYSNHYTIHFERENGTLGADPFWKILTQISKGSITGKILKTSQIANDFGIEEKILFARMQQLKRLGFEIRNHNTNKQIKKDCLLVPYAFPSLNERSLQRLTEL